jgi:DNA primase
VSFSWLRGWAGRTGCALAIFVFLILHVSRASARNPFSPQSSSHVTKNDYALIYGTVWGPDDRPVAGIPIKIRRAPDKKAKWELVSDSHGEFAQRVPVGAQDYIIVADIKTPKGQPKPQTTAHITNNERTDVGLHLTSAPPSR